MLSLTVRFRSSWTNSFVEDDGTAPRFTSGTSLKASNEKLEAVRPDPATLGRPGARVAYVQALQAANPTMTYRVPASFDNTVVGVLARLVGEVRRVRELRARVPEHLALRAFAHGRYEIELDDEHWQTVKLATPPNDIQTQGAGLIRDMPLYDDPEVNRALFGHLGLSLAELLAALTAPGANRLPEGEWRASNPAALVDRLKALDEEQKALLKDARKAAKDAGTDYESPLSEALRMLGAHLEEQVDETLRKRSEAAAADPDKGVPTTVEAGALDGWLLPGAVTVAKIRALDEGERERLIGRGVLTRKGNLAGMSMTGNIGRVTPKDMFHHASGIHAVSRRMPYMVNLPVQVDADGRTVSLRSGVIVRSGRLRFTLEDEALAAELEAAIEAASVGPFHFGKKGVAHVERLVNERRGGPIHV